MKKQVFVRSELTAKQRLAVSRQSLLVVYEEPMWAGLLRWCIRRCTLYLEPDAIQADALKATKQSS